MSNEGDSQTTEPMPTERSDRQPAIVRAVDRRPGRRSKSVLFELTKIIAGGIVGLAVAHVVLLYGFQVTLLSGPSPALSSIGDDRSESAATAGAPAVRDSEQGAPTSSTSVTARNPSLSRADSGKSSMEHEEFDSPESVPGASSLASKESSLQTGENVPREPALSEKPPLPSRKVIPSDEQQATARAKIQEIFAEGYRSATTSPAKAELATELHRTASTIDGDDIGRLVMLREAYDLAISSGEFLLAEEVAAQICAEYELELPTLMVHLLTQAAQSARKEDRPQFAQKCLLWAQRLAELERFDDSVRLSSFANNLATELRIENLQSEAAAFHTAVRNRQAAQQSYEAMLTRLKDSSDDGEAHRAVGIHLCLEKNDWKAGLPHLAQGDHPELATVAALDILQPTSASNQVTLADMWYEIASSETSWRAISGRAGYWYSLALPNLTGLDRIRAERRIKETSPELIAMHRSKDDSSPLSTSAEVDSSVSRSLPTREAKWCNLIAMIDPARDSRTGQWKVERGVLRNDFANAKGGMLAMPVRIEGDYDLRISFIRTSGEYAFGVCLPVGESATSLYLSYLSGKCHGLSMVDGKLAGDNNSTFYPGTIKNDRPYQLEIQRRNRGSQEAVTAFLDGKRILHWEGLASRLSPERLSSEEIQSVVNGTPWLLNNGVALQFLEIELKMITGQAIVLADEEKAAP